MPLVETGIQTREDIESQKERFLVIGNEDGAVAEPEGDDWE